jgi:hypothetical protein
MKKEIEIPACWSALLNDDESVVTLLTLAKYPPDSRDPKIYLKPVPMLLASIWESFNIRCVLEASMFIVGFTDNENQLPDELKRNIAKELKQDKHELAMWRLAGDGWKDVILNRTEPDNLRLQSGKSHHIDEFYKATIGLINVSRHWKMGRLNTEAVTNQLDAHIKKRDLIVHRGQEIDSIEECWRFYGLVYELSLRTVMAVNKYVSSCTGAKITNASMQYLRGIGNPLYG